MGAEVTVERRHCKAALPRVVASIIISEFPIHFVRARIVMVLFGVEHLLIHFLMVYFHL
jgi:hypothetical protein